MLTRRAPARQVACNATAPPFYVVIGGTQFAVAGADLILPIGEIDGKQVCISGVQDGGPNTPDNIFILCVRARADVCGVGHG
jgi:hypothetical protein